VSQEFWAARQRMAACRIGNTDTTNPKMSEALSLHLDSEIKTRTRLEATGEWESGRLDREVDPTKKGSLKELNLI
jgi:hypothetical protein